MPQGHTTGTAAGRNAPARSASAARAHAGGEVSWVIDLGRPVSGRVDESVDASRRYAIAGLLLLMTAVWTFDFATLVLHAG